MSDNVNGNHWLQEEDPREIRACFDQDIQSKGGAHIIEMCRKIVANHAAKMIDGVLVDAQSANAIITVYDALGARNQAKYGAMTNVVRMGELAWELIARSRAKEPA
jgi:hypothetical protein